MWLIKKRGMVILKFCVARCTTFKPMPICCSPLAEQLWQMIDPSVFFTYKISLQSKKVMERIRVQSWSQSANVNRLPISYTPHNQWVFTEQWPHMNHSWKCMHRSNTEKHSCQSNLTFALFTHCVPTALFNLDNCVDSKRPSPCVPFNALASFGWRCSMLVSNQSAFDYKYAIHWYKLFHMCCSVVSSACFLLWGSLWVYQSCWTSQ